MIHRILIILFAIAGIISTFLPWLYYPKSDISIYGYMSDGLISGIIFFVILLLTSFSIFKKKLSWTYLIITTLLLIAAIVLSYSKHIGIEAEKITYATDIPTIAIATAGFHQGIGIYLSGIAGLASLIVLVAALFDQRVQNKAKLNDQRFIPGRRSVILSSLALILTAVIVIIFFRLDSRNNGDQLESIETQFSEDVKKMGNALANEDYQTFIDFSPPILIQNFGGRESMLEIIEKPYNELKSSGVRVKGVKLLRILEVQRSGDFFQAIIEQEVRLEKHGKNNSLFQKMLALSEDGGETWHYLNIENSDREEIERFYPNLLDDITF